MARPWRIEYPGAIYHVSARGNNRPAIFLDDDDRLDFLSLLDRSSDRFRLHLFAFCLMTNHYHLFLRTPEPNLAAAMKWLNATYTVHFHRRHRRSGHLFQGRYKSILVTDSAHWLHLSMYLHLNPVRAGLAQDPAQYSWSSFRDYTRSASRFAWLHPEEILSLYGPNDSEQRRNYRRECLQASQAEPNFWEEIRNAAILGAREIIEELTKKYRPQGNEKSVPMFQAAATGEANFPAELDRVGRVFQIEAADLLLRQRPFPARLAAYYHLVENASLPVSRVANHFNVTPSAVSRGLAKFRKQLNQNQELKDKADALKSKVKH
jgi:putative transposase